MDLPARRQWAGTRFRLEARKQRIDRHRAQVFAGPGAYRYRARLHLLVADHQLVGQLLQAVLADLVGNFFIAQIGGDPESRGPQPFRQLLRIGGLALGYVEHRRLHRGEPERERAGVVLDQDADEALHGAHDGAVEHDQPLARVRLADVLRAQAPGHAAVHLHGAALPGAADAVLEVVLDLWAIEGALARQHVELHPL